MSALTRKAGWEAALDTFLRTNATRRFRYGSWDCGLFTAEAIRVMTGVDLGELHRGRYASRRAAERLVGSVELAATFLFALHGVQEVAPRSARRGDAVLIRHHERDSLGVMGLDGRRAWCVGLKGLCSIAAFPNVTRAWRVG